MSKVERYTSFENMKASERGILKKRVREKKHEDFKEFILDLAETPIVNSKEVTKKYA